MGDLLGSPRVAPLFAACRGLLFHSARPHPTPTPSTAPAPPWARCAGRSPCPSTAARGACGAGGARAPSALRAGLVGLSDYVSDGCRRYLGHGERVRS